MNSIREASDNKDKYPKCQNEKSQVDLRLKSTTAMSVLTVNVMFKCKIEWD